MCAAVNAVESKRHTHAEVKKKWSDVKVGIQQRTAVHRQSVAQTGGGTGVEELTLFEQRVELWVTLLFRGWWEHL